MCVKSRIMAADQHGLRRVPGSIAAASTPTPYGADCCSTAFEQGPRFSILVQYFRMPANIEFLARWADCPSRRVHT